MPYTASHRAHENNIIDSARKLFNRHGFENVSIGLIMAGAGLTRQLLFMFRQQERLYLNVNCFFTDPEWKNCWEGVRGSFSDRCWRPDREPTCHGSILKTWRIRVQWSLCPLTLPAAGWRQGEPSKLCFERWSACWSGV